MSRALLNNLFRYFKSDLIGVDTQVSEKLRSVEILMSAWNFPF